MPLNKVSFETVPAPAAESPLRMDVACFIGFVAEREGVREGLDANTILTRWLDRKGYLGEDEALTGLQTLVDRPVPVTSIAEYTALFDGKRRLDREARLTGRVLPDPIPAGMLTEPLIMIVDGSLVEVSLPTDEIDLQTLAAEIEGLVPGLICEPVAKGSGLALSFALPIESGEGTLAVLAQDALGFPQARYTRSRSVGTVMDAALRQFFAMGGRKAYVVSLGTPPPLLADAEARGMALGRMMGLGALPLSHLESLMAEGLPQVHIPAAERSGLTHLYGLEDTAFLIMPDLPDLMALDRVLVTDDLPDLRPAAEFAECVPPAEEAPILPLTRVGLPKVDRAGLSLWQATAERVLRLIRDHRRDVHFVAALPRGAKGVDVGPFLPDSAFLLLAGPYLRTPFSDGLPMRALPADAALAGQLAATLSSPTPYLSPAARALPFVDGLVEPAGTEALPVTWIVQTPRTMALSRDITAASDPSWRPGAASRLAARLIRLAEQVGQDIVFDSIDARLMRSVTLAFEATLRGVAAAGGLQPGDDDPGYGVLCDRRTTTQNDIDRGILRAEVTFRSAAEIEAIRVILPIGIQSGGAA